VLIILGQQELTDGDKMMENYADLIWRDYASVDENIIERVSRENMEKHINFLGMNWKDFLEKDFIPLLRIANSIIKILETNQGRFIGYYWLLNKIWTETKFKSKDAVFLTSLIVDTPYQKKGYGSIMLEEVKRHARLLGGTLLLGCIQKSNKVSYHFFVDKNDFNVISEDDKNWMIQLNI